MLQSLAEAAEFGLAMDAQAAGITDVDGVVIDTAGAEICTIVAHMGAIVTGAVTALIIKQGTLANGSDMAALAGGTVNIADDDDGQLVVIEVIRPRERYLRLTLDRGTQNATLNSAIYLLSGKPLKPAIQDATKVHSVTVLASPPEA